MESDLDKMNIYLKGLRSNADKVEPASIKLKVDSKTTGLQLKTLAQDKYKLAHASHMELICKGKFIKDSHSIGNNKVVVALLH